mgnify:CR=1 FL=1
MLWYISFRVATAWRSASFVSRCGAIALCSVSAATCGGAAALRSGSSADCSWATAEEASNALIEASFATFRVQLK